MATEEDEQQWEERQNTRQDIKVALTSLVQEQQAHEAYMSSLDDVQFDLQELEEEEAEVVVDCMSCGREIPFLRAARHFGQCFRKIEAELSFSSKTPTELPGCPVKAFCNHFFRDTRSYCSRFAAVCPEHGDFSKLEVAQPGVVCGFLNLKTKVPCRREGRRCPQHVGWSQLQQSALSQEIVFQYLRLQYLDRQDELYRQCRQRRCSILVQIVAVYFLTPRKEKEERVKKKERKKR